METVVEGGILEIIRWLVREDALEIVAKGLFRESKISTRTPIISPYRISFSNFYLKKDTREVLTEEKEEERSFQRRCNMRMLKRSQIINDICQS